MVLLIGISILIGAFSPGLTLTLYENQPKLETINGNLIIHSGLDKNITFRTSGTGAVFINNVNMMRPQITRIFRPTSDLMRGQIEDISKTQTGVLDRLIAMERLNSGLNITLGLLQRKMRRLEEKLNTLREAMMEDNCESNPCQNGGVCTNLFDGFSCSCPKNWEGDTCSEDVNECENFADTDLGCQNGATCYNSPGGYNCSCASGYYGIHCMQRTLDCTKSAPGTLCGHGTCVQTSDTSLGYKCLCDQGWTTDGVNPACAVDVNECNSMKPHCSMDPVVQCINTEGSYQCGQCPAGFIGNGHYCTDLDECQHNNGGCSLDPPVACLNTRGSHSCGSCPPGSLGDGRICTPGGEGVCSESNICHSLARCEEAGRAINCYCPSGYTGNGIGAHGCIQLEANICSQNPCSNGGTCVPNGKNYSCLCMPGFNQPNCSHQACSPNPCMNGGTCIPKDDKFTCICEDTFDGALCENEASSCSGELRRPQGNLKYPPNQALSVSNAICSWLITTEATKVLNVTFKNFTLENSKNCHKSLQIHDGRSAAAPLIGNFCGNNSPLGKTLVSTRNSLYVLFRSGSSSGLSEFELDWDSKDPACGGTIKVGKSSFGTIKSPGYPGHYPQQRDCWWYIQAPPGTRVQFHFGTLALEAHATCGYDYISVHDGAQQDSPELKKYCNSSQPESLTAPSNQVTLHFHSDNVSTDMGFQIHYNVVVGFPGCGGQFTALSGEFGSPVQNGEYHNGMSCEYTISLPSNTQIDLEFIQFDMEDEDCQYNYVIIYEGTSQNDPLARKVCGSTIPPSYKSLSNELLLYFHTDNDKNGVGFRVKYNIVCGGTFASETGILTSPMYPRPYQEEHRTCLFEIKAPLGNAISLEWTDFDLENISHPDCEYDYVEVHDGHEYDNSTSNQRYCGTYLPPRMISSQNMLALKLVTDESVSGRGFKANYSFIKTGCGGIVKDIGVEIKLFRFTINENCTWVIVAPLSSVIQLTMSVYVHEHVKSADSVIIYDGVQNREIGRYCLDENPPQITSTGNILEIIFVARLYFNVHGFSAKYSFLDGKSLCGGNFISTSGTLKSPNYPDEYPENRDCVWTITVPTGQQIQLTVKTFEISDDCLYEYLEIRNGGSSHSPILGKYCGTNIPKIMKSFTNSLYLMFKTDSTRPRKGFLIDWTSTSTGCGGDLTSYNGSISSPNFPFPYSSEAVCLWNIKVSEGSTMSLLIETIDIEPTYEYNYLHGECIHNYLEVLEGRDLSSAKSLKKLCHTESNLTPIMISSNAALVRFQTDVSVSGKGFLLSYTTNCTQTIDGVLSGVIESPNFPNPYPHNITCKWKIVVPKGNRIAYEFSHFQLDIFSFNEKCYYDYLEIKEMKGENVIQTNTYCDKKPPDTSTATDVLVMNFVTDPFTSNSGFRMEWQIEGCCGSFKGRPSGQIMSPNYPHAYPRNTECLWTIEVEVGKSIELNITAFDFPAQTNCGEEGLTVTSGSTVILSLCDRIPKHQIVYSNDPIKIRFNTGDSQPRSGFSATFKAVTPRCGGLLTNNGILMSPHYPDNYDRDSDCEWIIQVDHTHSIELSILDFDLEYHDACNHDYVKIFDGDKELLTWCNNTVPNQTVYWSTTPQVRVIFHSDGDNEAKGFKIQYGPTCGSTIVTNSTGTISTAIRKNTPQTCTWIIQSDDPAKHITLSIAVQADKLNLTIYEGSGTKSRAITGTPGHFYYSKGNALTLTLNTTKPFVFSAHYSVYDNFCGGTYHSYDGWVSSPKYPLIYPNEVECIWKLVATPGNKMSIEFAAVDMETSDNCNEDYLEIRENDDTGKLLDVICGKSGISKIFTSDGSIWMKFHSNKDITGSGFLAKYTYENSVDLSGYGGVITTPMYPEYVHKQGALSWRITVQDGKVIQLTFTDFMFYHNEEGSCSSVLRVFDGYDEGGVTALEDTCGVLKLEPITSRGNVMYLQAQMHLTESKFRAEWKAIDKSRETVKIENKDCGEEFIFINNSYTPFSSPGYPSGYKENLNCSYIIQSSDPTYHPVFVVRQTDLEDSPDCIADRLTIYQSRDLLEWKELDRICNTARKDYSGKPYLKLNFQTDHINNRTGFRGLIKRDCGGLLSQSSGVISMEQLNDYGIVPCEWEINVRPGRKIQIEVEKFNHQNSNCYSYLLFKNGPNDHSPLLGQGKYCNTGNFTLPETHGNQAFIRLVHQGTFSTGFKLTLKYHEVAKECGDDITLSLSNNFTIIHSPNYPNIPDPHTECTWTITSTDGQKVQLEFLDRFDLTPSIPCGKEFVEVREGGTRLSKVVGQYCDQKPSILNLDSNVVKVTYFTDVSDPKNGFKAKISLVKCGASFMKEEGTISSPGYPNQGSYAAYSDCDYRIIAPVTKILNITFLDVSFPALENGTCSGDYVEVLSVNNMNQSSNRTEETLGKYCSDVPDSILTDSNEAIIRYRSSHSDTALRGFKLNFSSAPVSCGGNLNSESGIITSHAYTRNRITKQTCSWKVTVPKGRRIKIEIMEIMIRRSILFLFNDFELNSPIAYISDNNTRKQFYSSDNTLSVIFQAFLASNNRGFKLKYSSDEMSICKGDIDQRSGTLERPENSTKFYCDYQRNGGPFFENSNVGTLSFRILSSVFETYKMKVSWPSADRPEHTYLAEVSRNVTDKIVLSPFTDTRLEVYSQNYFRVNYYKVYYQVDKCGGLREGPFSIQLPTGLGEKYGPIRCAWQYKNMDTVYVELNISQVSFSKPCDSEYINIFKGPTQLSPLWRQLCGDNLNSENIKTQSNYLFIEYHSNDYSSNSTVKIDIESVASGCGGHLHKNVPIIRSPGYGSQYPDEIDCDWELIAGAGFSVEIAFIGRFHLEESQNCSNDYVEIYGFQGGSYVSMGRHCGRNKPNNITTTWSKVKVMFHSDSFISGDGFQISWKEICGGVFNATSEGSSIISPGFPHNYFNSMVCNYTLVGPIGKNVMVKFSHFDLEADFGNCISDRMTIQYKSEDLKPNQLQEPRSYCGRTGPGELYFREKLQIMFYSDTYFVETGFKFDFRIDSCGGTVDKAAYIEFPTNSDATYSEDEPCIWNITAPYLHTVVIRFEYFETVCLKDELTVYKGNQMSDENIHGPRICGSYSNETIKVKSSNAILRFKTNSKNELKAFKILVFFRPDCDKSITLTRSAFTYTLSVPPSEYEQLMDCEYQIYAPDNYELQLEFTRFDIAPCTNITEQLCTCDFLEVRDGSGQSEIIGTYCDKIKPGNIRSTSSDLYLRFVTDSQNIGTGFDISVTAKMGACGEQELNVTDKEATITSPEFPLYPNEYSCTWKVVGSMYRTIQLRFEEFDLEAGSDATKCDKDYLEIADSSSEKYIDNGLGQDLVFNNQYQGVAKPFEQNSPGSHFYCGNTLPPIYLSKSSLVYLKFKTNFEVAKRGFKIHVQQLPKCVQKYTATEGRLFSKNAQSCDVTIEVNQNYTIALYFSSVHFNGSCDDNEIKVYDGDATSIACGFMMPNPIFSNGNKLTLKISVADRNSAYDMNYLATDKGKGCGGSIYSSKGIFTSPLFPKNNQNNLDCRWDIVMPNDMKVSLTFDEFDFGSKETCNSNYVKVFEPRPGGDDEELARYCGSDKTSKTLSTTNTLSVRMVKTVNFVGAGFKIRFNAE